MLIWSSIEASCPICDTRLELREVGSGFAVGQDTDLLVRMRGEHVIQAEIHTCRKCRFSGVASDFLRDISPRERREFLREVSPTLTHAGSGASTATPLPHIQYYWAFRADLAFGASTTTQGLRLLRAYWCTRLSPSTSLPGAVLREERRTYLRGAIQKLRQGLRSETNHDLLYLVGELCRRSGSFRLAESYFQRFLQRPLGAAYLRRATPKLWERARARDASPLRLEAVLYGAAD
jgi:uncharacterized protein (DUF2225 family)